MFGINTLIKISYKSGTTFFNIIINIYDNIFILLAFLLFLKINTSVQFKWSGYNKYICHLCFININDKYKHK